MKKSQLRNFSTVSTIINKYLHLYNSGKNPTSSKYCKWKKISNLLGKKAVCIQLALGSLGISLLPTPTIHPALGAESITFSYSLLEQSIPIKSLDTYAKTGKIDEDLATYANSINKKQLTQLRKVLVTPISLNATEISQFLYTPIGERLLTNLGKIIQTESHLSGFYAIRAALILAAATEPKGFTLLDVLERFPAPSISINLARSLEIVDTLQDLVNQTQAAVAFINQQSQQQATTVSALNVAPLINLRQPGSFTWQKQTITLNDVSRNRTFPADIYLPMTETPSPVIVISHGLGSDRNSFAYLAEHLASYGFVVAVPEHPGSNSQQLQALLSGTADRVTNPREFIDRPLDVKYLLDEVSRLSQSNPTFRGHLNLDQIGVVGQSYGGYTALALAGAKINFTKLEKDCPASEDTLNISILFQCLAVRLPQNQYNLSDPRVKAIIAINPVDSQIFGQASLSQIKIPVMIVSGSNDTVAPALPEQIKPFTWLTTPSKYLVLINGGTHFSTIVESSNAVVPVPTQVIGSRPELARSYVKALSVPFFKTYVAQQPSYISYLSADYTNTISQQPLLLSLVKSLNPEQLQQAFK
ncbi:MULTISPECIES: alpha/beta hydrolase [Calothrix]|uniref:Alpha/beta hydrolase n=2 Tax=Calothrix TaxID=1186 RepID=A0ABR8AHM4_9CYAN|nr:MULTISPECIES: alpha/beta hydrolase [Calothrix]MBD2199557.1 alpha/beta hydrolase [Calothrix parietina FACHB-288]MBD2228290.1 alpha/beta hydrolase [Calothrix anomala FACHB-343]